MLHFLQYSFPYINTVIPLNHLQSLATRLSLILPQKPNSPTAGPQRTIPVYPESALQPWHHLPLHTQPITTSPSPSPTASAPAQRFPVPQPTPTHHQKTSSHISRTATKNNIIETAGEKSVERLGDVRGLWNWGSVLFGVGGGDAIDWGRIFVDYSLVRQVLSLREWIIKCGSPWILFLESLGDIMWVGYYSSQA